MSFSLALQTPCLGGCSTLDLGIEGRGNMNLTSRTENEAGVSMAYPDAWNQGAENC